MSARTTYSPFRRLAPFRVLQDCPRATEYWASGRRHLEAYKKMGRVQISAHVIDIESIVAGECDENVCRENFTPSEAVAIAEAIEEEAKKAAELRMKAGKKQPSEKFSEGKGRALDIAASRVGMSRPSYVKAKAVVAVAEDEPDK